MRRASIAVIGAEIAFAASFVVAGVFGTHGVAYADSVDSVALSDIADINALPMCELEDCSDVATVTDSSPGLWVDGDTGDWYLTFSDRSLVIVDDTATATVDGREYLRCGLEDCSDIPSGVGVWRDADTGREYFIDGQATYPLAP